MVAAGAAWVRPALFLPVLTLTYWLTNLLGLILLHLGGRGALVPTPAREPIRVAALKWLLISLAYTGGMMVLYHWGIVRPLYAYIK